MSHLPAQVAAFLAGRRYIVAGVSRSGTQPANHIFRRLEASGFDVVAVNPAATHVEGRPCFPDIASVPGAIDGLMVAAPPDQGAELVAQAAARGIRQVWFHRSFGEGSVSAAAIAACTAHGITPIVGGCPLMYCGKVDIAHRCFRWWLGRSGRVPT